MSNPEQAYTMLANGMDGPAHSDLRHVFFFVEQTPPTEQIDADGRDGDEITTPTRQASTKQRSSNASPHSCTRESAGSASGISSPSTSSLNPHVHDFVPQQGPQAAALTLLVPPVATHMYELRLAEGKGLGLFATRRILRGTLIVCEKPLVKIPNSAVHSAWSAYSELDTADRVAYNSLHAFEPSNLDLESASRKFLLDDNDLSMKEEEISALVAEHVRVMSIFSVNNFISPPDTLAVYTTASRLNHSCTPNVHHSYNPNLQALTVHAVTDILPGEELLTTYLGGEGAYLVEPLRNEKLRTNYGFTCGCFACSSPESDNRRALMACINWGLSQYDQNTKVDHPSVPRMPQAALLQALDLIRVLLEEGLVTIELSKAYRAASAHALYLGDFEQALEYAYNEAEVERNCIGTEIADLRRLGTATECWIEQILTVAKVVQGPEATAHYLGTFKKSKLKNPKKKTPKRGKMSETSALGL